MRGEAGTISEEVSPSSSGVATPPMRRISSERDPGVDALSMSDIVSLLSIDDEMTTATIALVADDARHTVTY